MNPDLIYNQFAVELKSIEEQIREIKQKQFTGTDTVQTYKNRSGGWDIDWTPVWSSGSQRSLDLSVQFMADEQVAPTNNMRYEILVDNKIVYKINTFNDHPDDCAVLGYVHDTFLAYAGLPPTPKLDAWYFNITAYRSGMNIKVRFTVDSTDAGTIKVVEI